MISETSVLSETKDTLVDDTFGQILKSNTNKLANFGKTLIRKLLATSAKTVSIGIVTVLAYAIYRSYRQSKPRISSKHPINLNNYIEPDIGKSKRTKEQIKEVFVFFVVMNQLSIL